MSSSLTPYEMQLVADPDILIAKNTIIQKVVRLFAKLAEEYKDEINHKLFNKNLVNPKISRGENYQGLPYVVLDFPRQFGKENIFAIRSFFWWGNFFSIALHIAGEYQRQYTPVIQNAVDNNLFADWYIGTGKNQWEHNFDIHNFTPIKEVINSDIEKLPFLKLAKKIPLAKWDETNSFFAENFKFLLQVLNA